MLATTATLCFYGFAAGTVWRCCPRDLRLLGLGTLPVVWISVCAIAGLLDTTLGIHSSVLLCLAVGSQVVAAMALARFIRTNQQPTGTTSGGDPIEPGRYPWIDCWPWPIAIACAIYVGFRAQQLEPWGGWDAMFTWVLRGRFLLQAGDMWRGVFSEDLALLHPDYPPLLGWALSSLWRLDGQETTAAIVALFAPLWPGFVFLVLGWNRIWAGRFKLDITSAIVIVMPILWKEAACRISDFAVAYAVLGSCAWYQVAIKRNCNQFLALAAFIALWSGLIKNEGLTWGFAFLFVAVVGEILFKFDVAARNRCFAVVAGAALPLLAIFAFKVLLSPSNDLVSPQRSFEIGEIVQPGILDNPVPFSVRIWQCEDLFLHKMIWDRIGHIVWDGRDWGIALWWWAGLLIFRRNHRSLFASLLLAIFLQIGIYYAVYLVTPYHPYWHLSTSLSRILTHVVPAGICLTAFGSFAPGKNAVKPATIGETTIADPKPIAGFIAKVAAQIYLASIPIWIAFSLLSRDWQLGQQPIMNLNELSAIGFPKVDAASYVTTDLGTRSLYATQFESIPTILVVDRREAVMLGRFPTEAELQRYCKTHGWNLEQNRGGVGWARDAGGKGLEQPVTVPRIR